MLAYGGGGHEAAGTCQIDNDRAETILAEIVGTIEAAERQPGYRLTDAPAVAFLGIALTAPFRDERHIGAHLASARVAWRLCGKLFA